MLVILKGVMGGWKIERADKWMDSTNPRVTL